MLITPFDIMAKAAGFNILQYAIDVYGCYQGLVGATRRSWAAAHADKLKAYIRGHAAGVAWLRDPANRDGALAILRKHLPQMSPELAAQTYLALPKGLAPDARFDAAGAGRVLELRSRYGEPKKALADPMKYYDGQYYEAALK
jgi:ABC-type nitrate/sulfonate/bicarbonate transport system substrate-binding protein